MTGYATVSLRGNDACGGGNDGQLGAVKSRFSRTGLSPRAGDGRTMLRPYGLARTYPSQQEQRGPLGPTA